MKVSIITVSYNSAATIQATIDSVSAQSYNPMEHIVIDGDSTDGTKECIRDNREKIDVWVSEPDSGIYDAMNKGIKAASGDIIGILNSDDLYRDNHVIEKVVNTFKKMGTDAVYGDLQYVDVSNTKVLRHWEAGPFKKEKFKNGWMPPHPAFFVRREVYKEYGMFDLEFPLAADYELMLRLLYKHEVPVSYLPEVLVRMRIGGASNESLKNKFKNFEENYRAWKKNGLKASIRTQVLKRLLKLKQYLLSG